MKQALAEGGAWLVGAIDGGDHKEGKFNTQACHSVLELAACR